MTIESGSLISDFNNSLPTAGDLKSEGDDHIRLIKTWIKATFPNITGIVTPTHTQLNYVAGVTSAIQTQIDAKAPIASPTFTGTVTAAAVTTTGNTILGDASTDTLNVGNGDLYKDASGNTLIGTTSNVSGYKFLVQSSGAALAAYTDGTVTQAMGYATGANAYSGTLTNHPWNVLTNNSIKMTVTADGRLYGSALHNNAGAVTGTAAQYIASGTYTPTLSSGLNVASSISAKAQWIRVGNVVHVTGQLFVTPTATGQIILNLTLPIASTFTADSDCGGAASCDDSNTDAVAGIRSHSGDRTKAALIRTTANTTQRSYCYAFSYEVK